MTVFAPARPLVDRVLPTDGAARTAMFIALAVVGTLILWASAHIKVPFLPVPVTLQTLAVPVLAALYGLRLGLATLLLYFGEAAMGLPVLTNGGGLVHFVGPTAGYLLGFVVVTAIVGWFADRRGTDRVVPLFGTMLGANVILFALGFAWLAWGMPLPSGGSGIGPEKAFVAGVAPFVVYDLVKIALAATFVAATSRLVRR